MPEGLDYPDTVRESTIQTFHGQQVEDPYRWLEDPDAPRTAQWVRAQNALSEPYLAGLDSHDWFHRQLREIVLRPRTGVPYTKAGRYFLSRNDGTQQQDVYFVADSLEELRTTGGRVLIDGNDLSEDGTSSVAAYTVSSDGRYVAYLVSAGGSDWHDCRIIDLQSGAELDDVVTQTKFSIPTWLPDNTSYLYLHFPSETAVDGRTAEALGGGQLKIHRIGTPQDSDELILEFPDDPRVMPSTTVSDDDKWLVTEISRGTERNNRLWFFPLETSEVTTVGTPIKVIDEADAVYAFIRTDGDRAYLRTDRDAVNGRIVAVELTAPTALQEVIAPAEATLEAVIAVGGELLVLYLDDAQPALRRFDLEGSALGTVDIEAGAILAVNGHVDDGDVYIGVSSVVAPTRSYHLDLSTGDVTPLDLGGSDSTLVEVRTERRTATSADGTEVPYFLISAVGTDMATPQPTLLYGYGGFNIPVLADYRAGWAGWLAAGGVLALANLRGGGEYGSTWHDDGRLLNKQHVFDDFIAIAERLKTDGVTTTEQLALHGRSNGGLLVGAVMTQRPDLAGVALPMVGVLDMLRYHLFTIGAAWASDFGLPDDAEMFQALRAYSPLHNVTPGTAYPATLVLTGDHDDRVVPAHSFKFTAALQHAQAGPQPILARIEVATGHGMGKPASMLAAEWADLLAFAADHTGLRP